MEAAAAKLLTRRTRRRHRNYTCPWGPLIELDASAAFTKRLAKEQRDGAAAAAKRTVRGTPPPARGSHTVQRGGGGRGCGATASAAASTHIHALRSTVDRITGNTAKWLAADENMKSTR